MLWELPRWIRPDIVCTEARNSGFVVYTSSTMEPSTSFTVNWKSNPLTNSWIKGGRGREGGRPRDNDITSPWYRLVDFVSNVATNPLPLGGEEIPQFLHGGAKANIQESSISGSLSLSFSTIPVFRFDENSFTRKKNERGNVERNVKRGLRDRVINDTRQWQWSNVYFLRRNRYIRKRAS